MAVFTGLIGMTAAAAVVTAVPALAVSGAEPGSLVLSPPAGRAAGPPPHWLTKDGCPSGLQGSAVLYELNTDGSIGEAISPVVTSVTAGFSGTLTGLVGQLITTGTDVTVGGTSQWVVGCFAGPGATGSVGYVQSTLVTLSADGSSYSSPAPRPIATTTTLTASPNPVAAGAPVTLTATVSAADGIIPPGEVEFAAGSTFISIAPLTADGVATTTTTFAALGTESRTLTLAAFLLSSGPFYSGSSGSYSEIVNPPEPTQSEPVSVTVASSGTFTVGVEPGTVVLVGQQGDAQGSLQVVTVSDTRNSYPGWLVSGQASDFTGSGTAAGHTISGNQLGWHPEGVGPLPDDVLGPFIEPAAPGLGSTAATLASAAPGRGFGTYLLRALLTLAIPPTAAAGRYDSILTFTVVTAGP